MLLARSRYSPYPPRIKRSTSRGIDCRGNRDEKQHPDFGCPIRRHCAYIFSIGGTSASAQVINGTPGTPSATITIDGRQIPPPPGQFGGTTNLDALQSTPYWQPQVVPPKGAPNVLLILTDDVGFAAPSTFGGVIPTPTLDRIANIGLRYTNFHTTSLCSPHAPL